MVNVSLLCLVALLSFYLVQSITLPNSAHQQGSIRARRRNIREFPLAAVLPGAGGPITGTLTVGAMNGISLFSNLLIARFALSWFPQLMQQFPILRPINTVTEPYLRIFRQVIPPIGGFDISAIPALFVLDIFSQTAAAVGAEVPEELKEKLSGSGDILQMQAKKRAAFVNSRLPGLLGC